MRLKEIDELVKKLETLAEQKPGLYKRRVFFLSTLTYVYLFGIMAVSVGAFFWFGKMFYDTGGNRLFLMAAMASAMLFLIAFASIWISLPAPTGIVARKKDYPVLFNLIQQVRDTLKGPRIHKVLITSDFTAAITQLPRLGILGWQKNFLILGVPIMQVLTPDQFKAVIAHEYGHLSGAHGKFGARIYRVRKVWVQLLERLEEQDHWSKFLFNGFFRWYVPYFEAYSFVLSRANEYEADACSTDVVGKQVTAEALAASETHHNFVNNVLWPSIQAQVDEQAEPPTGLIGALASVDEKTFSEHAERLYKNALGAKSDYFDTHPSLSERLQAVGITPDTPTVPTSTAANIYLDERLSELIEHFERDWKNSIAPEWEKVHAEVQQQIEKRKFLDKMAQAGTLTKEEMWELAWLIDTEEGRAKSIMLFQQLIDDHPEHAHAQLIVGEYLIEQDDESAIVHLEQAISLDDGFTLPASRLILKYLKSHNCDDEAVALQAKIEERAKLEDQADAERRAPLSVNDIFQPHKLDDATIELFRELLRDHWQIEDAYLVRKKVEHLPHIPMRVLAVTRQPGESEQKNIEFYHDLQHKLEFPVPVHFVLLLPEAHKLWKKMGRVKGGYFYNRMKHRQT